PSQPRQVTGLEQFIRVLVLRVHPHPADRKPRPPAVRVGQKLGRGDILLSSPPFVEPPLEVLLGEDHPREPAAQPPVVPPPGGDLSVLHGRPRGGSPVEPLQLDLPPDELRMHALAMLIEPVGIDEPGGVVVRVCEHRIQQSVSLGCCRHFASFLVKMMTCCHGRVPTVGVADGPGTAPISLSPCRSLILWTSLIGPLSSSSRNSTNTSRPPGLSAATIFSVISNGWLNSWYTSTSRIRSTPLAGSFGSVSVPCTVSMFVTFSFVAFASISLSISGCMSEAITLPISPTSGDIKKVWKPLPAPTSATTIPGLISRASISFAGSSSFTRSGRSSHPAAR